MTAQNQLGRNELINHARKQKVRAPPFPCAGIYVRLLCLAVDASGQYGRLPLCNWDAYILRHVSNLYTTGLHAHFLAH